MNIYVYILYIHIHIYIYIYIYTAYIFQIIFTHECVSNTTIDPHRSIVISWCIVHFNTIDNIGNGACRKPTFVSFFHILLIDKARSGIFQSQQNCIELHIHHFLVKTVQKFDWNVFSHSFVKSNMGKLVELRSTNTCKPQQFRACKLPLRLANKKVL